MLARDAFVGLLGALCLSAVAGADGVVWVVPAGGQIQAVVDLASDGDTLLIKQGSFAGFTVEDKALSIVADGSVSVHGEVVIAQLSPGKLVVLSGLKVFASTTEALALLTESNAGALRIQGCTFEGLDNADWMGPGGRAARIANDVDTVLVGCTLNGGDGANTYTTNSGAWPGAGGVALFARASGLSLYGCNLKGGRGGSDDDDGDPGGKGGHAFESPVGTTSATGCEFHGGSGGAGGEPPWWVPGDPGGSGGHGGHGVFLGSEWPGSELPKLRWRSSTFQGGHAGHPGTGVWGPPGQPGQPGQPIFIANGVEVPLGGPARFLAGTGLVRENHSAPLQFTGEVGDQVYLQIEVVTGSSVGPRPVASPALKFPLSCGVIPAGGKLSFSMPVGLLPMGADVRLRILRPIFIAALGEQVVSNPFALTIVDQQF
jgi:hypothetical protein